MGRVPAEDLLRIHAPLYRAGAKPALVDVPPLPYLMVDGTGAPGGAAFRGAAGALIAAARGVRSVLADWKRVDCRLMPLQGRWWPEPEGSAASAPAPPGGGPATWRWTLMILQPRQAGPDVVSAAFDAARAERPAAPIDRVRLAVLDEGRAAQILHVGPADDQPHTLERLAHFAAHQGYAFCGPHHEVYLSDPAATPPERMSTILRYPVEPAEPEHARPGPLHV
ncbi:GyrI-like domain-containing protein [Nocardiopsis coralliicola]